MGITLRIIDLTHCGLILYRPPSKIPFVCAALSYVSLMTEHLAVPQPADWKSHCDFTQFDSRSAYLISTQSSHFNAGTSVENKVTISKPMAAN